YRRSSVGAAAGREALLVDAFTSLDLISGQNAVVRTDVEQPPVSYRRGLVGPAALLAPGYPLVRLLTLLKCDVAARARLDRVDRLNGRVAVGYNNQTAGDDRCRARNLRIMADDLPELLPGHRVVAADALGAVGDQLGTGATFVNGGRTPGGKLRARCFPNQLAVIEVECRQE